MTSRSTMLLCLPSDTPKVVMNVFSTVLLQPVSSLKRAVLFRSVLPYPSVMTYGLMLNLISQRCTILSALSIMRSIWPPSRSSSGSPSCLHDDTLVATPEIPRAPFSSRPVYLATNPFGHTYKRNHEGDYICSDDEVRHMFTDSESLSRPFDGQVFPNLSVEDSISADSVRKYKILFEEHHPSHPWLQLDTRDFLKKIGAIDVEMSTKDEGLTLAGILMFGHDEAILHVAPGYFVDYREKMFAVKRWTDRICLMVTGTPIFSNFTTGCIQSSPRRFRFHSRWMATPERARLLPVNYPLPKGCGLVTVQ